LKPDTRGKNRNLKKKQGAPKGHKGTTRYQKPERKEIIDTDCCPIAKSKGMLRKKELDVYPIIQGRAKSLECLLEKIQRYALMSWQVNARFLSAG
jgi:hypothetical protein